MTDIDRARAYLALPPAGPDDRRGLRWSIGCDAIETPAGDTLAVADEVGRVLEGVFTRETVPPFPAVLHLVRVMKAGAQYVNSLDRLREAFGRTSRAAGVGRNAGRLIAELCRAVPPEPDRPQWAAVRAALKLYRISGEGPDPWRAGKPRTGLAFEAAIAGRLYALSDDDLDHWLRYGTGPSDPGEELAKPVEELPVRTVDVLGVARTRPRLVGAAALVPALDAALSVPPRRPAADAVPQGGYADVTTRGDPARLLPSQFALDPDEFVRRFAGNELLYFKREEPHAAPDPERIIVLDQGVRTWGGVRLGLAAAALSLLTRKRKRPGRVWFGTTAAGVADVAELDGTTLADRLEASDLSPNPGEALRQAGGGHELATANVRASGGVSRLFLPSPRNRGLTPPARQ